MGASNKVRPENTFVSSTEDRRFFKHVHDNVHDNIYLDPLSLKFIDTEQFQFQRLRHLTQLGLSHMVYPGAVHSRFEHSLGVYCWEAGDAAYKINANQGVELGIELSHFKRTVKLAGLLHYVGHGPFSHLFEREFLLPGSKWSHEDMSLNMIDYIVDEHNIDIDSECMKKVKCSKEKLFLYDIVANGRNGIDVDKFFCLVRDSRACGLGCCSFQFERMLDKMRVIDDELCYRAKEYLTIHKLFFARADLHRTVYTHAKVKAIMFVDALVKANDLFQIASNIPEPSLYWKLDNSNLKIIETAPYQQLKESRDLILLVNIRNLYQFCNEIAVPKRMLDHFKNVTAKDIICSQDYHNITKFLIHDEWISHLLPSSYQTDPCSNFSQNNNEVSTSSQSDVAGGSRGKNTTKRRDSFKTEETVRRAGMKQILKESIGKNLLIVKEPIQSFFEICVIVSPGVVTTHVVEPRSGQFSTYKIIASFDKWVLMRSAEIVVRYSFGGNGNYYELPNLPPQCPPKAQATFTLENLGFTVLMWTGNNSLHMMVNERGKNTWDDVVVAEELFAYFREHIDVEIEGLVLNSDGRSVVAICSNRKIFQININGTKKMDINIPFEMIDSRDVIDACLIRDVNGRIYYLGFTMEGFGLPGRYRFFEVDGDGHDDEVDGYGIVLQGRDILMVKKSGFGVWSNQQAKGIKIFNADPHGSADKTDSNVFMLSDGGLAFTIAILKQCNTDTTDCPCTFAWIAG